jgi:hypothetical protein
MELSSQIDAMGHKFAQYVTSDEYYKYNKSYVQNIMDGMIKDSNTYKWLMEILVAACLAWLVACCNRALTFAVKAAVVCESGEAQIRPDVEIDEGEPSRVASDVYFEGGEASVESAYEVRTVVVIIVSSISITRFQFESNVTTSAAH